MLRGPHQVHMLPTKEISNLTLGSSIHKNKLGIVELDFKHDSSFYNCYVHNKEQNKNRYSQNTSWLSFQHLYFTSNEEIKEGDWCIRNFGMGEELVRYEKNYGNTCRKIAATTNPELWSKDIDCKYCNGTGITENLCTCGGCRKGRVNQIGIPKIDISFVEVFVKEYNKGDIIKEVLLEYEYTQTTNKESYEYANGSSNLNYIQTLKLRNNDSVIVHPVKDTSAREIIEAFVALYGSDETPYYGSIAGKAKEWLSKNKNNKIVHNDPPMQCQKCGWIGSREDVDGGGQIADTGDYGDIYCPACGQISPEECEDTLPLSAYKEAHDKMSLLLKEWREKYDEIYCRFIMASDIIH